MTRRLTLRVRAPNGTTHRVKAAELMGDETEALCGVLVLEEWPIVKTRLPACPACEKVYRRIVSRRGDRVKKERRHAKRRW